MSSLPPVVQLPKQGDSLLGKYTLEKPLGQGGMGIVYSARHELLGQRVAVKFLLPEIASNADAVARFLNEARAASRIESDHVARVLDVGLVEGALPYMVLEFLDGEDLAAVLRKRGPLPIVDVADFMLEAIDALAYAHALGIVHRDLKPSNLFLVRRQDGTARVKVLDFGISKSMGAEGLDGGLTKTNAMLGSPLYMSPEQLRDSKNVDHRCDIWALGVMAYELLTSHPPFMADNAVALFAAIQEAEPVSPRERRPDKTIPPALERAILLCLRRNPTERFSSVTELGAALVPFATGVGAHAFENAKRILPLRASPTALAKTLALVAPTAAPAASSPASSTMSIVGAAYADTADPWATSNARAALSGRKRGAILKFGVPGILGVAGLLVATRYVTVHRGGAEPARSAAVSSPTTPSASAVTGEATSLVVPSAAPAPPTSARAPLPSVSPATRAIASRTSPTLRPPGTATSPTPPTASASAPGRPSPGAAAPNCDPPYTIDSVGHHVLKRGCE